MFEAEKTVYGRVKHHLGRRGIPLDDPRAIEITLLAASLMGGWVTTDMAVERAFDLVIRDDAGS